MFLRARPWRYSRRWRRCSWKRTRLKLSGWLKHADLDALGLERSPFCVCWARVWSGAGKHGRSLRARTTRCWPYGGAWEIWKQRLWQFSKIPASRRARRVRQNRNHHVSPGHRGHFTRNQLHLPSWAQLGKVQPWAADALLGQPRPTMASSGKATRSLLKQSHHHKKHSFQHLSHISSIPGHPTQHITILIPAGSR